jgi:hypothetical protein
VEKYGRARQATKDNIIPRMLFACWITKATDTHSEYVIRIAFPRQQWLRERASVLRYTCIAYRVWFNAAVGRTVGRCRREGRGGKPVQTTGARRFGKGPGARLCSICFCISRQYHCLSTVQINPFRPSPSHSVTDSQSFRFSVKIFSRSALIGGGGGHFFHRDPNQLSAALPRV